MNKYIMCLEVVRAVKTIKAGSEEKQRWTDRCSFILGGTARPLNKGLNGDEPGPMDTWGKNIPGREVLSTRAKR